ncbi:hypothetical protein J6590_078380 [Homalodisca vitripennis]|nr:hypothetical protein J6590_078380 [Homalodisca vitripennis]
MDHQLGVSITMISTLVVLGNTQLQVAPIVGSGCNDSTPAFECEGDHICVGLHSLCNGIPDCPSGQDETVQQCGCLANEFSCGNSCVALVKRCDRHLDCFHGEDEEDCNTYKCPPTHFNCNNHFCVPLHSVCDFIDHCGDGSDEINCQNYN